MGYTSDLVKTEDCRKLPIRKVEAKSLGRVSVRLSCSLVLTVLENEGPVSRNSRKHILIANLTHSFFQTSHKSNFSAPLDYTVLDGLQVNA